MLKIKLDKAAHSALPPEIQKEYKADGEGFILDTDTPFEDITALKAAVGHEKEQRRKATEKAKELETSVASLTEQNDTLAARAKPAGELEKSWQQKLDKAATDAKARHDALTGQIQRLLVDNKAQEIASAISTAPEVILPHIKARLGIEEVDGVYHTRVLDDAGKVSADSLNELQQKFVADAKFASIITASKASGGGAAGGKPVAGGKAFRDMSEAEKTTLFRSNKTEYDRLSAAAKQAK